MELMTVHSLADLPKAAAEFVSKFGNHKVFAFYGEMGVGKTTFIKAICHELGVKDTASSPTFSLINEYLTPTGQKIFHFDFYRITNEGEAYDFGYEEYFYSGNLCFIEWPEKVETLLPTTAVKVRLEQDSKVRLIRILS